MGKEVTVVSEDDLGLEDEERLMDNCDLVISMGGDHTFLRSQAMIKSRSVPIMGINTVRANFNGVLNSQFIDFEERQS